MVRRLLRAALPVILLAAGLGLVVAPASASCAGPTLDVVGVPSTQATPTPPRTEDEAVAAVTRGASITVESTNVTDLSGGCQDTTSGGCDTVPPAMPGRQVALILEQGSRTWSLGVEDASGPTRTISYAVVLPSGLKAGRARLSLEGTGVLATTLRLDVA
jgi:hypothetical protein